MSRRGLVSQVTARPGECAAAPAGAPRARPGQAEPAAGAEGREGPTPGPQQAGPQTEETQQVRHGEPKRIIEAPVPEPREKPRPVEPERTEPKEPAKT